MKELQQQMWNVLPVARGRSRTQHHTRIPASPTGSEWLHPLVLEEQGGAVPQVILRLPAQISWLTVPGISPVTSLGRGIAEPAPMLGLVYLTMGGWVPEQPDEQKFCPGSQGWGAWDRSGGDRKGQS